MKNKTKIYICLTIFLLLPIIVASGTIAITDLAISSFSNRVENFFSEIKEGAHGEVTDKIMSTFDTMTLQELIIAVQEDVVTQEVFKEMRIERDTFLYLLNKVNQFNSRTVSKTAMVQVYDNWYDTNESAYYTEDIQEKIKQMQEAGELDELMKLIEQVESERYRSSTDYISIIMYDTIIPEFCLDWQLLYLFSNYYAITTAIDINEWNITKETIDYVFPYLIPTFFYDMIFLDSVENLRISINELSDYRVTVPYYETITYVTDGNTHTYSGRIPYLTVEKVETLFGIYEIQYQYNSSTGIVEHYISKKEDSNYLDKLYIVGEQLCFGFDLDILLKQLRMLPGGTGVANSIENYENMRLE